jgi:hypothetical protein
VILLGNDKGGRGVKCVEFELKCNVNKNAFVASFIVYILIYFYFVLSLQQDRHTEQVVVGGLIYNVSIMCVICDVFYSFQSLLLFYVNTMIINFCWSRLS